METIEAVLSSMELRSYIDKFHEEAIDLDLIKDLDDNQLKELLEKIDMKEGDRMKIRKHFQRLREKEAKKSNETENVASVTEIQIPSGVDNPPSSVNDLNIKELRLVLLGKTGSGKSASGNTILGSKTFESEPSGSSVTQGCVSATCERFGQKLVVVDTPGIFDTSRTTKGIQFELSKCIGITSPGPHAFILVLSLAVRFTDEEKRSVEHFVNHFGEDIYKYFIILFTRLDELKKHNKTINEFLHSRKAPPKLIQFIKKCEGRVFGFDNDIEDERQVQDLLKGIGENVFKNGGKCYTNEMYTKAEEELRKQENERLAAEKAKKEEEYKQIENEIKKEFEVKIKETQKELQEIQSQAENLREREKAQQTKIERLKNQKIEIEKKNENKLKDLEREHSERLQTLGKSELKAAEKEFKRQKQKLLEEKERCTKNQQKEIDDLLTQLERSKIERKDMEEKQEEKIKKLKNSNKQLENSLQEHKEKVESDWNELKENLGEKIRDELRKEIEKDNSSLFARFRQWLGLFIAGIDKDMLLDEIENKMHNLVENAKPANFNSTANDNNGDNKNDSDGDDKDDSEENNETDG